MLIKLNPAIAGSVEDMVTGDGCAMAGSYKVRRETLFRLLDPAFNKRVARIHI